MLEKILTALRTQTLRDTGISFLGQATASIAGLGFFVFTFRLLGERDFGIFSLAYSTAVILKDFVDPAINAAMMRFVPSAPNKHEADKYIKYAGLFKVSYFIVVIPLLLLFSRPFSLLVFKQQLLGLIPIILITAAGLSFAAFLSGVMRARKQFALESIYTFSQPLIRLILLGCLYLFNSISVVSVLTINVTAYLVTSAIVFYVISHDFVYVKLTTKTKKMVNKFLPPMVMASTTGTITDRVNLYITNYYLDLSSVGTLSAITRLFTPVPQLAGALDSVLGTRFSSFNTAQNANRYLKKAVAMSLLVGLGLIGSNLVINPILGFFGPNVRSHKLVFTTLTVGYSLFLMQVPFISKLLYFKGRADLMARVSLIQFVCTIIFNILLIPQFGLLGAGLASIAIYTVSLSVVIMMSSFAVVSRE